ncbi:hypothetical protein DICVIV_09510 [Dictyocaulus viviparus]|uniref:C-type lectin domain-containing protein n=1 Tax=Dictyocaulus viviparus TaxID=29172 RepID=A0A0D8XQ05_DICVI|nr:hypothetical protein DICVIV_09510 [Dictyocaulus viviparus]
MFCKFLICLLRIFGAVSFPLEMEGSGEESHCSCSELATFDSHTTATTASTDLAVFELPIACQCCKCCCPPDRAQVTTITTTTQATKELCCCCHEDVNRCKQQAQNYVTSTLTECPSGWIKFQKSCYFIVTEKMNLMEAQRFCLEKESTLFVADSIEEFNKVMKETPPFYWSWIGVGQSEADSIPQWGVIELSYPSLRCLPLNEYDVPTWGGRSGVDPTLINWLITPYSSIANGWSTIATCAGYYNAGVNSGSYAYFYPCSSQFYSICEKNSTLLRV